MIQTARLVVPVAGAVAAAIVLFSLSASAGHPLHTLLGTTVPDCIGKWCPDDYCPKREPYVCVPLLFGCDDYRCKKAPCVCAPLCFQCDDYCAKCPPKVCSGPLCQFLRCGPPRQPCGCAACIARAHDAPLVRSAEVTEQRETGNDENAVQEQPAIHEPLPLVIVRVPEFELK